MGARRQRAGRPQLAALGAIVSLDGEPLGPVKMTSVISRLSDTPGEIRRTGGRHGADAAEALGALGVGPDELARLRRDGVV